MCTNPAITCHDYPRTACDHISSQHPKTKEEQEGTYIKKKIMYHMQMLPPLFISGSANSTNMHEY